MIRIPLALLVILSLFSASQAEASATIGDAALTVAVATVSGAVLGASTLPFYENSSDHTENIFYGAAVGAVIGVFISAYAGVQEGPDYDEARIAPLKPSALAINDAPSMRLRSETSTALRGSPGFASGTTVAWSQLAHVEF